MNEHNASRTLRTVPREKAFYFFTSIGNYTGSSASSLEQFIEKVDQVNVKSVTFHFLRGDFEKWVAEVLEDKYLADKISSVKDPSPEEETLRQQLYKILTERYSKLRRTV